MKVRSLLAWTAAVLIVLILVLVAAVKLFLPADRIVAALIPRLEETLDRQVEYGNVEYTIFSGIGVCIRDIRVKNDPGFDRPDFLRIGALDCKIRLWPLLKGELQFRRLTLEDAELYLIKTIDGITNYHRSDPKIGTPGDEKLLAVPLAFADFTVNNGCLVHRDDSLGVKLVLGQIDFESSVRGQERLSISGKLEADSFLVATELQDFVFVPAGIGVDLEAVYFAEVDSFHIRECKLEAGGIEGRLQGGITDVSSSPDVDLAFVAPRTKLRRLQESPLLTAFAALRDLRLDGDLRIDAAYDGLVAQPQADNLKGKITITDLKAASPRLDTDLKIKLAELNFNSQSISFFTEEARIGEVPASFRMAVDNFDDPNLSAELKFASGVNFLSQLMQLDPVAELSGRFDLSLSGFMRWQEPENLRLLGAVTVTDLFYAAPRLSSPVDEIDISCQFLGKDLQVQEFHFRSDRSELRLSGIVFNFAPYVAKLGKPEKKPLFDFELVSDYFDLDILTTVPSDTAAADSIAPSPLLACLPDFDAAGSMRFHRATFGGIEFYSLKSQVTALNRIIEFDSLSAQVFSGVVAGEVIVDLSDSAASEFEIEVKAYDFEINRFLSRFTSFDDHLFGRASLLGEFKGQGSLAVDILPTLRGSGSFTVSHGKLVDFKLSQALLRAGLASQGGEQLSVRDLTGGFTIAGLRVRLIGVSFKSGRTPFKLDGIIGFAGSLDCTLEISISAQDARYLAIPPTLQDRVADLGGIDLTLHIGGSAVAPTMEIRSIRSKRGTDKELPEGVKHFLNRLLESQVTAEE